MDTNNIRIDYEQIDAENDLIPYSFKNTINYQNLPNFSSDFDK